VPGEIALGPVGAEPGLVLSCIPYIEDADGTHEIELRSADIDVCAVLNAPECLVGGHEIVDWQGLERSTVVRLVQGFKDAASVV